MESGACKTFIFIQNENNIAVYILCSIIILLHCVHGYIYVGVEVLNRAARKIHLTPCSDYH